MARTNSWQFDWRHALLNSDLPCRQKLTLLTLAHHMNTKHRYAFPSLNTLARESSQSRNTVIKYINLSCEQGWIHKRQPKTKGRGWPTNHYYTKIPNEVVQPKVGYADEVVQKQSGGSAKTDQGSATSVDSNLHNNLHNNLHITNSDLDENRKALRNAISGKPTDTNYSTQPTKCSPNGGPQKAINHVDPKLLSTLEVSTDKTSTEYAWDLITKACEEKGLDPKILADDLSKEDYKAIRSGELTLEGLQVHAETLVRRS